MVGFLWVLLSFTEFFWVKNGLTRTAPHRRRRLHFLCRRRRVLTGAPLLFRIFSTSDHFPPLFLAKAKKQTKKNPKKTTKRKRQLRRTMAAGYRVLMFFSLFFLFFSVGFSFSGRYGRAKISPTRSIEFPLKFTGFPSILASFYLVLLGFT